MGAHSRKESSTVMDDKPIKGSSVTDAEKIERREKLKSIAKDAAIFFTIFVLILLVFRYVKFPQVSGSSMNPGLQDGQRVVALKTTDVEVGDVIIVWVPSMNEYIIKRVVGVAGDEITISHGKLYRNGIEMYEPYLKDQNWDDGKYEHTEIIPDGEVFVLGDNRNESADSRIIGSIPVSDIQMKIVATSSWINKFK